MSDDKHAPIRPFDALNPRGLAGKREYVRGLEQRSDAEALSLLVECLCDESWYLRDLAEESLLRMGAKSAEILVPLLDQSLWYTRSSAARVLGRCAFRPAVPGLVRLTQDANKAVADAARDALVGIGRGGGAITVARSLYAQPPETRSRRFEEIRARDPRLADRMEKMMRQQELMAPGHDDLTDQSPMVRATEEGLEWEVLTSPAAGEPQPPRTQAPRGEPPDA